MTTMTHRFLKNNGHQSLLPLKWVWYKDLCMPLPLACSIRMPETLTLLAHALIPNRNYEVLTISSEKTCPKFTQSHPVETVACAHHGCHNTLEAETHRTS